MSTNCFCHFNGYEVKDANARANIETLTSEQNLLTTRVDNLTANSGESTEGNAELIDIRVDHEGITHDTAGNSVRDNTSHVAKPIVSIARALSGGETFDTLTSDNGLYSFQCTPSGNKSYVGLTIGINKTQAQLGNVIVKVNGAIPGACLLSRVEGNWSNPDTYIIGEYKDNYFTFNVDEKDLGTNNLYILLDYSNKLSAMATFSGSVVIYNIPNSENVNMTAVALHSLTTEPINYAEKSTNSTYSINSGTIPTNTLDPLTKSASNNDGTATFDGVDTYTVTKVYREDSTGVSYTIFSVKITDVVNNLSGIIVDKSSKLNNLYITSSINSWSSIITTLNNGFNSISNIDFSQYSNVYITGGIYGHVTEETQIGTVKIKLISNGEIFATDVIYDNNVVDFSLIPKYKDEIVCWGDSLTAGGGWTSTLQTLSGKTVINAGTGGENVYTITSRQGADVMMINNITIPDDTSPVTIATYSEGIPTYFGNKATPLLQGGSSHINPVTVNGVECTLSWTGSNYADTSGVWTLKRNTSGEGIVIDRPTAIVTKADRENNGPYLMIIYMGQNGGYTDNAELIQKHKLMIDHANAKHTIILGLSSGSSISRADYENAMRNEFGRYFISLREYLSTYGLEDAGLTPTEEDITAMSSGTVPPQLLSDSVHYTSACKTVIGNMIYKRCRELNIF